MSRMFGEETMIREEKIYYVECDQCHCYLVHTNNCENVRFSGIREAEINAEQQNWTFNKDGEHYCPACQEELEQERVYD